MDLRRLVNVAAIFVVVSTVFYVSFLFFTRSEVLIQTNSGISAHGDVLAVKITALSAFLIVATIGLYVLFDIMTHPQPEERIRRDTRRYVIYSLKYELASPPEVSGSVETEEECEDESKRRW